MKKWILVLVVLAAVIAGIAWSMDTLVEKGVEEGGSVAFGTPTRVENCDLDVLDGVVTFEGLSVRNPEGFSDADAIRVSRFDVETRLPSLLSDVIEVDHIVLEGPEITLEVGRDGTNLGALLEHLDAVAGGGSESGTEPQPDGTEPSEAKAGKKVRVGLVRIEGAKVRIKQSLLGESETTVELPPLELTDLGAPGEEGAESEGAQPLSFAALLERILGAITAAAAGEGAVPEEIRRLLQGELDLPGLEDARAQIEQALGGLKDQAGEKIEEVEKQVEEAAEKLKEGLGGELKKGLGGLLGGKKEKEDG